MATRMAQSEVPDEQPPKQVLSMKRLLSVEEAAYALGIGRTFCYALVMRRKIFSIKLGRNRLIPVKSIDEFIAEQMQEQGVY